jgi:pentatricopeptide repeat protein
MPKALELLNEVQKDDVAPNVVTYETLIMGCVAVGNMSRALKMFEVMQKRVKQ